MATLTYLTMTFLYSLTVIGAILLVLGWVRGRFPGVGLLGMLMLSMLLSVFIGPIARLLPWWALIVTGTLGAWQTVLWVRRLLGMRPLQMFPRRRRQPLPVRPRPVRYQPARPRPAQSPLPRDGRRGGGRPWPDPM